RERFRLVVDDEDGLELEARLLLGAFHLLGRHPAPLPPCLTVRHLSPAALSLLLPILASCFLLPASRRRRQPRRPSATSCFLLHASLVSELRADQFPLARPQV